MELTDAVQTGGRSAERRGNEAVSQSGARTRTRRSSLRNFGRKSFTVFMAVVLAVGLCPMPAFGDDGTLSGVTFNGATISGDFSSDAPLPEDEQTPQEVDQGTSQDDAQADFVRKLVYDQATQGLDTIDKLNGYVAGDGTLPLQPGIDDAKEKETSSDQSSAADEVSIPEEVLAMDFSSKRVIVALSSGAIDSRDQANITSSENATYMMQFADETSAREAYVRYSQAEGVALVAPDAPLAVAADIGGVAGTTEGENGAEGNTFSIGVPEGQTAPAADLASVEQVANQLAEQASSAGVSGFTALIDTGASADAGAFARFSVIGGTPDDENGHGTAVANAYARAGAQEGPVAALKAFDGQGVGTSSSVYAALTAATNAGAQAIYLRLNDAYRADALVRYALDTARSAGVRVVDVAPEAAPAAPEGEGSDEGEGSEGEGDEGDEGDQGGEGSEPSEPSQSTQPGADEGQSTETAAPETNELTNLASGLAATAARLADRVNLALEAQDDGTTQGITVHYMNDATDTDAGTEEGVLVGGTFAAPDQLGITAPSGYAFKGWIASVTPDIYDLAEGAGTAQFFNVDLGASAAEREVTQDFLDDRGLTDGSELWLFAVWEQTTTVLFYGADDFTPYFATFRNFNPALETGEQYYLQLPTEDKWPQPQGGWNVFGFTSDPGTPDYNNITSIPNFDNPEGYEGLMKALASDTAMDYYTVFSRQVQAQWTEGTDPSNWQPRIEIAEQYRKGATYSHATFTSDVPQTTQSLGNGWELVGYMTRPAFEEVRAAGSTDLTDSYVQPADMASIADNRDHGEDILAVYERSLTVSYDTQVDATPNNPASSAYKQYTVAGALDSNEALNVDMQLADCSVENEELVFLGWSTEPDGDVYYHPVDGTVVATDLGFSTDATSTTDEVTVYAI